MALKKEVICKISKDDALFCIAESDVGPLYVDAARADKEGQLSEVPQILRSHLGSLLDEAEGLVCICDDSALPGYEVAFYSFKFNRWFRLKTDSEKVAQVLESPKYAKLLRRAVS